MIKQYLKHIIILFLLITVLVLKGCTQKIINSSTLLTKEVRQYEMAEFNIQLSSTFKNPYDQNEIALDMVLISPANKKTILPCYFVSENNDRSLWKAKFTPRESGVYSYQFELVKLNAKIKSARKSFNAIATSRDGFLHTNGYWTLRFDSGKPFRGIGENVGWESRSHEESKWTYDHLLSSLHNNGANFFRTWMCVWNLPIAWPKVNHTNRYTDTNGYFNESGSKRMDELVMMCDSLKMYFMVSIDPHGALIPNGEWKHNPHNKVNGGPASTPEEFFTNAASKAMYKNRLRYIVARWGWSANIGAWEFFNEIDNAVFTPTPHDSVLIDHKIITAWHKEMSAYLKAIDPYNHIVTTSISHRDIAGMNELADLDINQKHIYNRTHLIPPTIKEFSERYHKPYVIGEFGYDWNWDNVKHEYGESFDFDYKRGLWYGTFSSTPILPMTWWWEFFDERKMTPYFKSVRFINDEMLAAGKGSFEYATSKAGSLESYAVKCGDSYFLYLLNNSKAEIMTPVQLSAIKHENFTMKLFQPGRVLAFHSLKNVKAINGSLSIDEVKLAPKEEMIFVFTSEDASAKQTQ
jgi:hypothetical protein